MCGIYGITERNKKLIENIIQICSHRGPDGFDIFENDNLTLGHNLLSITSAGGEIVAGSVPDLVEERHSTKDIFKTDMASSI